MSSDLFEHHCTYNRTSLLNYQTGEAAHCEIRSNVEPKLYISMYSLAISFFDFWRSVPWHLLRGFVRNIHVHAAQSVPSEECFHRHHQYMVISLFYGNSIALPCQNSLIVSKNLLIIISLIEYRGCYQKY